MILLVIQLKYLYPALSTVVCPRQYAFFKSTCLATVLVESRQSTYSLVGRWSHRLELFLHRASTFRPHQWTGLMWKSRQNYWFEIILKLPWYQVGSLDIPSVFRGAILLMSNWGKTSYAEVELPEDLRFERKNKELLVLWFLTLMEKHRQSHTLLQQI